MIPSHFRITPAEGALNASIGAGDGSPILLTAYPIQLAMPLPATSEVVGRAWLEDVGISDGRASREHMSFTQIERQVFLTDRHSHNGTFVGGVQISPDTPTLLHDGAIIRIGHTIFVYREAFKRSLQPERPLGPVVGPWGIDAIRRELYGRAYRPGLNVLVDGPVGTEKALLAREIASRLRPGTKSIEMDCATVDRNSFDQEMFGWEKQRFTGSFRAVPGRLRAAAAGVLVFDEFDKLPMDCQSKLVPFLEKRDAQPLGARDSLPPVDCLVVATTTRPIRELVDEQLLVPEVAEQFRIRCTLPPLRERVEDLFAILIARWTLLHGKSSLAKLRIEPDAIELLMRHSWPDNVNELQRFVESLDPSVGIRKSSVERFLA